MAFRVVVVCAIALLSQSSLGACIGNLSPFAGCGCNGLAGKGIFGNGLGWNGLVGAGLAGVGSAANGLDYPSIVAAGLSGTVSSTRGGLPVASSSPIAPIGVSVLSENAYEGTLSVGGNLPFLGTVSLECVLPTAGAGAVFYGCGDGAVGIAAEGPIATGITGPSTFGPNPAALGSSISASPFGAAANYPAAGPNGPYNGYAGVGTLGINGLTAGIGDRCGSERIYSGIGNGCGCNAMY